MKEGQVLLDRVRDRARLQAQKQGLEIQIDRLKPPVADPPPSQQIPELVSLPPATFLDEIAEVEATKLKVQVAQSKVIAQERKIDLLDTRLIRDLLLTRSVGHRCPNKFLSVLIERIRQKDWDTRRLLTLSTAKTLPFLKAEYGMQHPSPVHKRSGCVNC